MKNLGLIRKAFLIRRFEELLLSLFASGKISGTVHTCIGQEWSGVAAAEALRIGDVVFSNHRCHGHYLAWIGDVSGLLAEIMGKSSGVCGGIGGSQHIYSPGFYSNGIQGGMLPIAAGKALAKKMSNEGGICAAFIGDGTFGQGIVYETLNIASKWGIPLLVVVENNRIAQSTRMDETFAGTIEGRAKAFDIAYRKSNTGQEEQLMADFAAAVSYVRGSNRPLMMELVTYRLKAHSKGDDTRSTDELSEFERADPLNRIKAERPELAEKFISEVDQEIAGHLEKIEKEDAVEIDQSEVAKTAGNVSWGARNYESKRISKLINEALAKHLKANPRIIILGEDVKSPYGGAFKVTSGLSDTFPDRVFNTPISEGAIIGLSTGMALGGYLPVAEIMFGDFLSLCFDQLINHACKLQYMYHNRVKVPLVVRVPMGGKRGYGPTHSQSLEKHFLGIPDLDIVVLNPRISPVEIYDTLLRDVRCPTLVIENKVLYSKYLNTRKIRGFDITFSAERFPTLRIRPFGKAADVTILCHGEVLDDVESAVEIAFDEYDLACEILCPTLIQPLNIQPLLESVGKTNRLMTVEEGIGIAGVGSEAAARLLEAGAKIDVYKKVCCHSYIPTSRGLEARVLPSAATIEDALKEFADAR